ncbi:protein of unknown function [Aminobacter niigataensis]|nr:protein of unknown function [Aminobacter niigataensis]
MARRRTYQTAVTCVVPQDGSRAFANGDRQFDAYDLLTRTDRGTVRQAISPPAVNDTGVPAHMPRSPKPKTITSF